ncbi:hypothetical protein LEN26_002902 [Aphanomyces euteiches]|nr:hypothetical protein AeMF1_008564 [Aphanomyces euteiches]KAH9158529.1 hypothetical protein LEN26_002902 [Aphanomyces euteiches]KAH9196676.1 hypothetical protein AeNC1_001357 [Aphanomyces euteiches]
MLDPRLPSAASLALSFKLKRQCLESYSALPVALHEVASILDEVAMLAHAHKPLVSPCEQFIKRWMATCQDMPLIAAAWLKAKTGLRIKLVGSDVDRPHQAIADLIDATKLDLADKLAHFQRQNKWLSTMLREYPRATERGFDQSDASIYELFKRIQRLSIDAAIIAALNCANSTDRTSESPKKVSFDQREPQVIGQADGTIDRAPVQVTTPRRVEMLIIRGSRVLSVV